VLLLVLASSAFADSTSAESTISLPQSIGKFTKLAKQAPLSTFSDETFVDPADVPVPVITQIAEYVGKDGTRALVQIFSYRYDGEAYEIFSFFSQNVRRAEIGASIGTASIITPTETAFFEGVNFVRITNFKGSPATELAQSLSELLDKGEGDIPVLIKHLPNP